MRRAFSMALKKFSLRHLSQNLLLKHSMQAFSIGLPIQAKWTFTPLLVYQAMKCLTFLPMTSRPRDQLIGRYSENSAPAYSQALKGDIGTPHGWPEMQLSTSFVVSGVWMPLCTVNCIQSLGIFWSPRDHKQACPPNSLAKQPRANLAEKHACWKCDLR